MKFKMENFAKKLAINQKIIDHSSPKTFPLKFLEDDFEIIKEGYELLLESVAKNVPIPPSGEWLLDNFYIIEEQVNFIKSSLNLNNYKNLPGVTSNQLYTSLREEEYSNREYQGISRIYILAREFVAYTDGRINKENIERFLNAYQSKKAILQSELYEFPIMIQISLIEHIRNVADRIIAGQLQKFKVESLVERIIKNKDINKQIFRKYKNVSLVNEASSYVEYLIYLLKKIGNNAKPYLDILEEEIIKVGTTSSEIIKAEHFDMAIRRVSISNSILSLKNITRLNWTNIFENVSYIEKLLMQNKIYSKLDFETKEMYRNAIKDISKMAKVSEIYVTNEAISMTDEETSLGELLIGDKKDNLLDKIEYRRPLREKLKAVNKKYKLFEYLISIYLPTILLSLLISPAYSVILFIPISEIFVSIVNKIVSKTVKPRKLPRISDIDEDINTFVIVPTLLNSKERVENMIKNLEIYYLANKMDGLYFCLLGDASEENTEIVEHDEIVEKTGIDGVKKLNEKYNTNIFNFIYRKRVYNKSQEKWLGYERKRGMITEFNDFLINGNQGTFRVNTIKNIPKIKYVITLDADTELVLDSAQKLIGTMEHPLNKPVIKNGRVVKGYGLIQPKVGVSIESANASTFSKLFAGSGGIDIYTTAESNVYQDLFGEAIFTGKGIYNVEVFEKILKNEIPENTVLSHDLLEGSYIRVGLATDIEVIDGFPSKVNSYMLRLHRWTRGDWQILRWLRNKKINALSKYKILDNLRRSLVDIFTLLLFFCGFFWTPLIIIFFPLILELEDRVLSIFGKINFLFINRMIGRIIHPIRKGAKIAKAESTFEKCHFIFGKKGNRSSYKSLINGINKTIYRCLINLIMLPYKASVYLKAIVVTLYRVTISKKHLLEWVTAADAEKTLGKDLRCYIRETIISPIIGLALILSTLIFNELSLLKVTFLFLMWYICPFILWTISNNKTKNEIKLKSDEIEELKELAKRTWSYFDTYINKENNFLIPDNYEEKRKKQITSYTSSTNIGLSLLSIVSARDLNFIDTNEMVSRLKNVIDTIVLLEKWNGHLYNWYNIKTLKPVVPGFVSTVDSGNFVSYLFVLKTVLDRENLDKYEVDKEKAEIANELLIKIKNIIEKTDFSKLYDYEKNLFSIGFDLRENKLIDSYYDLLASEARCASFIAIAKRDISYKHWFYLGRAVTTLDGYKGLVSWSGTMFEYFMPLVIMKNYKESLLGESYKLCLYSQKEYAKKLDVPWGISESAFNLQDLNYNYQYKAFGIPWLGLKRGLNEEVVISPYSSILTISQNYKDVISNIKKFKTLGAYDKFGMYEALDYTPTRVEKNKKYALVKTYMAHHQGLILLSINNFLNQNILQKNFSENPEIKAVEVLLGEKVSQNSIYTKEKKEKVIPLKYKDYEDYNEITIKNAKKKFNIISNDKYTVVINDCGEGYSKYEDIYINKYNASYKQSNIVYIKNLQTNEYYSNTMYPCIKKPDEYTVCYSPSECKFYRKDGQIETHTRISVSPEDNIEIREISIRNNSEETCKFDVISYLEPIISEKDNDIVHPAYNSLFLCTSELNGKVVIEKRFHNGEKLYITNFASTETENIKYEVELDKAKFIGRGRSIKNPLIIEENKMFSDEKMSTSNTIVSMKSTVQIKPNEEIKINYYIGISNNKEEIENLIEKYTKKSAEKRIFEMAMSRSIIENRFFDFKFNDICMYNKILTEIINGSKTRNKYKKIIEANRESQKELWKYGISGDFPIILIKIRNVNDIYVIKELVRAIIYFEQKNIKIDLVIIDEERGIEKYTGDKIVEYIKSQNIEYLIGARGGIHLIKVQRLLESDEKLIYSCSDVILDAKDGFLKEQI